MLTCAACSEFAPDKRPCGKRSICSSPPRFRADFDRRLYERIEKISWWDRLVGRGELSVPRPRILRRVFRWRLRPRCWWPP